MASISNRASAIAILFLTFALGRGGDVRAQVPPRDYASLKGEMKVLEAVIDETLRQTFTGPFGLLEKTKGTYLPGFGPVFSVEVNLYPVRVPNPFDARPLTREEVEKAQRIKRERIEVVKSAVTRLLADHAGSLRRVGPEETVAVVVHLFHFQAEGESLPTQLVLQMKKADLDAYQGKKLAFDALLARVRVLEL